MKGATSLLAFGVTTVALGLVVWLALLGGAQTTNEPGFVIPATVAHLPVVTLGRGEAMQVHAISKSTANPPLTFHVQFSDANGFDRKRDI